ncbi:aminotransferase class V-fold PLP-dependent enzyme [Shinella sp. CPCC 100929]|uniref:Aminotransferase class V-fold PLP-dependent enzyme n=1 Tax=Shinella lacus TaxID=2654216 RepID=A0ABT1RHN4_9HYPH|nr:aminotransferase class V-fold PLP-dependent enzyme [Shinella lacus]MCQ4634696.1 aminotransferase class V-fold PLP-dependent enzyme [Shinella lacus]
MKSGTELLMIPGPTTLPAEVLRALARPSIDIYQGPLHDVSIDCIAGLQELFGTREKTYIFTANGHGAWEAALCNTLSRGDLVLVLESGFFAVDWADTAKQLGLEIEILPGSWRAAVDPQALAERLAKDTDRRIRAVLTTQVDTASGVCNDIPAIRRALTDTGHDALLMVDCIASLGATEFRFDEWGIDLAVAASQKALMTPPGLAFHAVGPRARQRHQTAGLRTNYWDWTLRDRPDHYYWHSGTPPVNLLFALQAAIGLIRREGLSAVIARHDLLAEATRLAVGCWSVPGGVELNIPAAGEQANSVTLVRIPEGTVRPVVEFCQQHCGVLFGEGIGPALRGRAIRIGHMGHVGAPQLLGALGCLEMAFKVLDIPHAEGGVAAAISHFAKASQGGNVLAIDQHAQSIKKRGT